MKFTLKRPCPKCPFRKDCTPGWLSRARAEEIAGGLLEAPGTTFSCHETTQHDEQGEYDPQNDEQHCVGAMILIENEDFPNQMLQIAERLDLRDPGSIDSAARELIFPSRQDFEDHHANGKDEVTR